MEKCIKIDAFHNGGSKITPFQLFISEPFETEHLDYFCRVSIPTLFKNDKLIYGIDKAQAKKLAIEFVSKVIDVTAVVDENGTPIDFDALSEDFLLD